MSSKLTSTVRIVNYIASGLLTLIALGMAILSIVVLKTGPSTTANFPQVLNMIVCLVITIVAALSFWATDKQVRFVLGILACVGGILFVLCTIGASISCSLVSNVHHLAGLNSSDLNDLPYDSPTDMLYSFFRITYQDLYTTNDCRGPVCEFSGPELTCSPIACLSGSVTSHLNGQLNRGITDGGVTEVSLSTCEDLTPDVADWASFPNVNDAWCIGNTQFIAFAGNWILGVFIVVWIITFLVLVVSVLNCLLFYSMKRDQFRAGVVFAAPEQTPQMYSGGVTPIQPPVVRVVVPANV
ncbi:hypothetical protein FOZ63_011085 [Perkinsus olseni]|nr:hypothetical protein FOZ63_011085 [Perkinsus olseni]